MHPILVRGAGLALVLLLTQGALLAAQRPLPPTAGFGSGTQVGIGYVGNAPEALLGAGAFVLVPNMGGIGAYGDFKRSLDFYRADPYTLADAEEFGDLRFRTVEAWYSVNAALVRRLTPELAMYAGAGYARRSVLHEYEDLTQERGELGFYLVEDPEVSGGRLNLLGGGFFRAGPMLAFQFGGELAPLGFTVGASLLFPRR